MALLRGAETQAQGYRHEIADEIDFAEYGVGLDAPYVENIAIQDEEAA